MEPILELRNVSKSFGALEVLKGLSFSLQNGEALGLLGPNGAGKTTLLNVIAGELPAGEGAIVLRGEDISGLPAHLRCRRGICRTNQVPRPFEGMTVLENALVGATYGRLAKTKDPYDSAAEALGLTGLLSRQNELAGRLGLLDRKRLELARALAAGPRIMLIDEIAGGLTDYEVAEVLEVIRKIRLQGIGLIWIEHIIRALTALVDRVIAIHFGALLAEGTPQEILKNEAFKEVYFGLDVAAEGAR